MSLQLILGGSGSGKSTYLYDQVVQGSLKDPGAMYIVIVPEQYTMATQRLLVDLHPRHALMNIEILSFERLAMRVFDELGTDLHSLLTETGKTLFLLHLISNMTEELPNLGGKLRRPGFLNEIKSLISELSLYHISPEELLENSKKAGLLNNSMEKTKEICRIYRKFLDEIEGSFITAEQILELLIPVVEDSAMIRDSVMVFDGFTGFTPLQNELMSIFMRMAKEIKVALCVDPKEDVFAGYEEDELFAITKRTAISLKRIADASGCISLPPVRLYMDEKSRFPRSNAISFIEANLFRNKNCSYEEDASELTIVRCSDPRREVWYAAAKIHRLVRTKGYRYSDIAISSYSLETYSPYVEEVFKAFDIPVFLDEKSVVSYSPCFEFITAALEMEITDYSYESVMHFLRSGPWICEEQDKDLIDRYLSITSLRGAATYSKRFSVSSSEFDDEERVRLEEIRENLWSVLNGYHEAIKASHTVRDITIAVYELMRAYDIEGEIEKIREAYENTSDEKKEREYSEIYRITIDILDQFVSLLGDKEVSVFEYSELFVSSIENAKVGRIPATNDSVIVGDIERTRIDRIKTLILLGANDGVIPKAVLRGGLLSQSERLKLSESGLDMAPTDRQQTFMQRFYLYMILTKPSENLIISYSDADSSGGALRPSYLIGVLKRMIRGYHEGGFSEESLWIESKGALTVCLSEMLSELVQEGRTDTDKAAALLSYFDRNDKALLSELMEAADHIYSADPIKKSLMRAIDKGVIKGSVSRMESYSACAFKYFLQYILKLKEPPEAGLEAVDMGTLYHNALLLYETAVKENGYDFGSIEKEDSMRLLKAAIDQAFAGIEKPHILSSARQSYILKRMEETLKLTVWALHRQVSFGDYVPTGFETALMSERNTDRINMPLSDDCTLSLTGRIDRYDLMEKDDKTYYKVVDYKSSKKTLELPRIYNGLELQLLYYMQSLLKKEKSDPKDRQAVPAAVFYYALLDPVINADWDTTDDDLDSQMLKALRPAGMMGEDDEGIFGMDRNLTEARDSGISKSSEVIPASLKKDGTFTGTTKLTPEGDFLRLCEFSEEKIKEIGEHIVNGEFKVSPYRQKDKKACDYCPYSSVCGFDANVEGFGYKDIDRIPDDEIMNEIRRRSDD